MAWLRAGQKDFVAARAALARLKTDNERAQAPVMAVEAQIDEMAGDKAAAEAKYRRAVELDPSALRVVITAADGLRRLGKADDARALLKTFGDKYSDSVVMDGAMAANAPMPKPPSPASGISEILFDIGSALNGDPRNQRGDLALIFEQFAVDLKPDHDFAWLTIASLYEQWGNSAKALAAYGKVGPTSPLYWQARLRAAALDAQEERFDAAVRKLRVLVAEKPDRIDAALTLADLLRSKERYADAVAAYDTAIQRINTVEERHWPVFFGRGIVLERIKQWPRAEADMKKALELSPEQPYVLNYLGYSWIDQGLQPRRRHEDAEARDRAAARRRRHHRLGGLGLLPPRPVRQGGRMAASGRASRRATTPPWSSISATPTGMSAAAARRASSGRAR